MTASREPVLEGAWIADGSARQRRRREPADGARARHRRRCPQPAVRRPPRVRAQRGGRLPDPDGARARSTTITSGASIGEVAARAWSPGRESPERDHALQVVRPGRRGPGRRAPHLRESARRSAPASGCRSAGCANSEPPAAATVADARRTSARRASALDGLAVRTPLVQLPLTRPTPRRRDLPQAREPAAHRLVQDSRRGERDAPRRIRRALARRRLHGERRQHGAGRRLVRAPRWACRAASIVPDTAPGGQARRDRARSAPRSIRVPFADWWQVMVDARHARRDRASSSTRSTNRDVMAGNGTIGAGDPRGPARRRRRPRAVWRRRAHLRHRRRHARAAGRERRVIAAEVETAAPLRASLDAGEARAIDRKPSFVDGIGGASVLQRCGRSSGRWFRTPWSCPLDEIAEAVRLLVRHARIVAEGAGAAALPSRAPGASMAIRWFASYRAETSIRCRAPRLPKPYIRICAGGHLDAEKGDGSSFRPIGSREARRT